MWEFHEVRKLAIATLTPAKVDPIERIEAARNYRVHQWYWPALRDLAEAPIHPTLLEYERLGLDFATRLAELWGKIAGYKLGYVGKATSVSGSSILFGAPVTSKPQGAPVPTSTVSHLPTLDFIAELFAEEVKDVPISKCDEVLKLSCRYGQ
ncbi:hypothetical protein H0H81_005822 [Sphagnurus paluster]|uniref:Uncharacterized protein n=1 Tax=Sphagnurus paluster TaxID=117069 RepID=A0A9P7GEQ0_9AGAR|nr:hypothetical protein H0H81_005822 [Sphagnurus paluster]